ncbi:rSAM-modified peptide [Flavobacterium collinsii]|nr:rSAM-modified peptide [Flavobacterium collinsii]
MELENFGNEKLSKKEQQTICGGDGDTIRGNGKGSNAENP